MRVIKGVNDNFARPGPPDFSVRHVTGSLAVRHGNEADSYWRQMIADMRARMVATGIREEAIEGELRAFSASVFSEIRDQCA